MGVKEDFKKAFACFGKQDHSDIFKPKDVITIRKLRYPSRSKYFKKFAEVDRVMPDGSMTKGKNKEKAKWLKKKFLIY